MQSPDDEEDDEIRGWIDAIQSSTPNCLQAFATTPLGSQKDRGGLFSFAYDLSCMCGQSAFKVLGSRPPVISSDPDYEGLRSPIDLCCLSCDEPINCIDSQRHGYNAEIAILEGRRRFSNPVETDAMPAQFHCPMCSETLFTVSAWTRFLHFDILFDATEDAQEGDSDSEDIISRPQDFFNGFEIRTKCISCGTSSTPMFESEF